MHEEITGDILSCVVYTQPGRGAEVATLIGAQPGAEVLAGVDQSKLVVTIEDSANAKAAEVMAGFNALPGVISTLLIYHCAAEALATSADDPLAAAPDAAQRPASLTRSPACSEDSQ
jgi:nitrate reductase NapAB chaperone NapD